MSLLKVEQHEGVVTLTLNDPERRNLLSAALCEEIIAAVHAAEKDESAMAIVIRGAGKAFCAGADLEDLKAASRGEKQAVESVYASFMCVANSTLPTLAVVEGAAVGAGMNLALACDMRVATPSAWFDTRFLQIGLHPGGGHGWMLLRAVGWQTASEWLLLSQRVDAQTALVKGLIAHCYDAEGLDEGVAQLLGNLSSTPRELLVRTKESLRCGAFQSHESALKYETEQQMWSLHQPAFEDLVTRLQKQLGR